MGPLVVTNLRRGCRFIAPPGYFGFASFVGNAMEPCGMTVDAPTQHDCASADEVRQAEAGQNSLLFLPERLLVAYEWLTVSEVVMCCGGIIPMLLMSLGKMFCCYQLLR
jgi:hypothetical protein